MKNLQKSIYVAIGALSLSSVIQVQAQTPTITQFTGGDLVISTVSDQLHTTPVAGDLDTASPIVLQEFQLGTGATSASMVGTLTLPQTSSGPNSAISGEYGSASEGILEDSADGKYLTVMGYGVNANTFNTAPLSTYGNASLGQTTSLTGQTVTTVPRVVALIGTNATVDTSTALTGVFNDNNPRSAATVNGTSFYVSGQGAKASDGTGGVFYATDGATTATVINNSTSTPSGNPNGTASASLGTEARAVEIVNVNGTNTLLVSRDTKVSGTPNDTTDIRTLTNASGGLPTSATGLVATRTVPGAASVQGGNTGSIDLTAALDNNLNSSRNGKFVYLSPEQFFLASPTVMYVTDSGAPKNGSANAAALGEGGLQKWDLVSGTWTLQYDLYAGLNLVNNANANSGTPTAPGVTGLFGLEGEVVGNQVELFATSYGLNELSPSFLYEITDTLSATTGAGESFTTLYSAPAGTSIRGVAFAAVPEPSAWVLALAGVGVFAFIRARRATV